MQQTMVQFARKDRTPIQASLRQSLIGAMGEGRLSKGQQLPPSRTLAQQIGVARNTVTAVYEDLVAKGYLVSVERRGYFVQHEVERPLPHAGLTDLEAFEMPDDDPGEPIGWDRHLKRDPSGFRNLEKPSDWQRYPFPFIYGQVDRDLFPIDVWRACSRDSLGRSAVDYWAADRALDDDDLLIEQICRQILPQRGIFARPDEVMITLGSQHGLYLLSQLLMANETRIAVEDPGYPDARNIFEMAGARLCRIPVDQDGITISSRMKTCDLAYVTPSHQCPTMVTMSPERRETLIDWAERGDRLIIEDDYEGEPRFANAAPALKAIDRSGRVLYLGTLSKVLAPGVRIGYMVAPQPLIRQARALRRLMHRSAPLNNQRTAAIFLADGHYTGLVRALGTALSRRWDRLTELVETELPGFERSKASGGSSVWLKCPPGVKADLLHQEAAKRGVLIEPGDPFFADGRPSGHIRLGLSSISEDRIEEGLRRLKSAANQ